MSHRTASIVVVCSSICVLASSASALGQGSATAPAVSPAPSAAASPVVPASSAVPVSVVTNPWFPLIPGTTMTYEGIKDERHAVEQTLVTDRTSVIAGANCVAVEDTVSINGTVTERTLSYYSQDAAGAVWLCGEDVTEVDPSGQVISTDGSWRAGLDGATPSLFMEAAPAIGDVYDHAATASHSEVTALATPVQVPFGSYAESLVIAESSPDEPDVLVDKVYVQGVGLVRDVAVRGLAEEMDLTDVQRP